jgi:hypothetical protein
MGFGYMVLNIIRGFVKIRRNSLGRKEIAFEIFKGG